MKHLVLFLCGPDGVNCSESDGVCLYTWPPAASAGPERVNSPSEVLKFLASCLYPQLFALSPLPCPLSPVACPEPHTGLTLLCLPHTLCYYCGWKVLLATTALLAFLDVLYLQCQVELLAWYLFSFVNTILFFCYHLKDSFFWPQKWNCTS